MGGRGTERIKAIASSLRPGRQVSPYSYSTNSLDSEETYAAAATGLALCPSLPTADRLFCSLLDLTDVCQQYQLQSNLIYLYKYD